MYIYIYTYVYIYGGSINGVTPKSSILIGFSLINNIYIYNRIEQELYGKLSKKGHQYPWYIGDLIFGCAAAAQSSNAYPLVMTNIAVENHHFYR